VIFMIPKRKKSVRMRAKTTHGYGSMKKNRGYGNKGGKGHSGSGKRGDAKKPRYWAQKRRFGKHGFNAIQPKNVIVLNIYQLEQQHQKLLKQGLIKEEKGVYSVDLKNLGVDKLLSKGTPSKRWNIKVKFASASAQEKIKEKDGSVLLTIKDKVETPKASE
jgi:large subunit ribosomal protein L15